mmetsp:Transcript_47638/g.123491  ORF Transcript_47638/g.123491 Transcript_47638/m.123491 type:complete len:372 (-) Transcript_47638:2889-4004(-)
MRVNLTPTPTVWRVTQKTTQRQGERRLRGEKKAIARRERTRVKRRLLIVLSIRMMKKSLRRNPNRSANQYRDHLLLPPPCLAVQTATKRKKRKKAARKVTRARRARRAGVNQRGLAKPQLDHSSKKLTVLSERRPRPSRTILWLQLLRRRHLCAKLTSQIVIASGAAPMARAPKSQHEQQRLRKKTVKGTLLTRETQEGRARQQRVGTLNHNCRTFLVLLLHSQSLLLIAKMMMTGAEKRVCLWQAQKQRRENRKRSLQRKTRKSAPCQAARAQPKGVVPPMTCLVRGQTMRRTLSLARLRRRSPLRRERQRRGRRKETSMQNWMLFLVEVEVGKTARKKGGSSVLLPPCLVTLQQRLRRKRVMSVRKRRK